MPFRHTTTLLRLAAWSTAVTLAPVAAAEPASGGQPHEVLDSRTEVTAMADDVLRRMDETTFIEPGDPAGVAVFAVEGRAPQWEPGVGVAREEDGEAYFLNVRGQVEAAGEMERYVIFFYDPGLFRDFRQGRLDGADLAPHVESEKVAAHRVYQTPEMQVEPLALEPLQFELNTELERARIATPEHTEQFFDEDDPPRINNQ